MLLSISFHAGIHHIFPAVLVINLANKKKSLEKKDLKTKNSLLSILSMQELSRKEIVTKFVQGATQLL